MNPTLQLNLSQQLKLNPQLQQSIKLLQLSQMALQQEIQYQLESNPLLNLIEDSYTSHSENGHDSLASNQSHTSTASNPTDALTSSQYSKNAPSAYLNEFRGSGSKRSHYSDNLLQDSIGLREHLEWQIQMSSLNKLDLEIAYCVIENINDAGFLTVSPKEIASEVQCEFQHLVEPDEVTAVIHLIQQLTPLGCASSGLQEFLLLQLKQLREEQPSVDTVSIKLAQQLIEHHFNALRKHRYQELIDKLSLTSDELAAAVTLIKQLRNQPNYQYLGETTEYIKPDIMVSKRGELWVAELTDTNTPQLEINTQYANSLSHSRNASDRNYLHEQLQRARGFIQSIEARTITLQRVANWIVKHQQNFFARGESALKPMRLKDIASDLELHESTISRACSDKYLQSPQGIFELKFFFSNAVPSTQGGEWSSKAVKNKIKQIIKAEPSRTPLSDLKLTELLKQEGISIARRTVAKYREAMNIPPANERKLLTNS